MQGLNMPKIKLVVENQNLTIERPSGEEILAVFDDRIAEVTADYQENGKFTPLFEREATNTQADIDKERAELVEILQALDNENYDYLIDKINSITRTKKGVFRKNGVAEFFVISSVTTYFTDYTNAWYSKVLKLRALTPTTLELVFEDKTYTF